jgi:restriction endonuclease S subunit
MAKTYIENIKLTAIRSKLFSNLVEKEYINIFDVLTLSSGDFLPIQKMINGEYSVFGGGGITDKRHNEFNIHNNTLGIGRVGARCGCVFKIPANSWVTDNALYASKIDDNFDMEFLIHYLNFKNLLQYANTSAQPVISLKRISPIKIPFLSLQEQKEIVKILDDVENGIVGFKNDKYEIKGTFNIINSKEDISSELTRQLDLIKQLRHSFLHEAMQGKLVKSTNTKETGQQLLAKIKAEKGQLIAEKKLKKEKIFPPISEGEIPFEIPEHWAWCRLGEIINISSGDGLTSSQMDKNGIIPVYGGNGVNGHHNKFTVQKETIVIGRVGYYCGCVHLTEKKAWITDNAFNVKYSEENINREFLIQLLRWAELGKQQFAGSQPVISGQRVYPKLIPFPPLHEQEQIVAKLHKLMAFCDGLEHNIMESQGYNKMLLQQVLREALQREEE